MANNKWRSASYSEPQGTPANTFVGECRGPFKPPMKSLPRGPAKPSVRAWPNDSGGLCSGDAIANNRRRKFTFHLAAKVSISGRVRHRFNRRYGREARSKIAERARHQFSRYSVTTIRLHEPHLHRSSHCRGHRLRHHLAGHQSGRQDLVKVSRLRHLRDRRSGCQAMTMETILNY